MVQKKIQKEIQKLVENKSSEFTGIDNFNINLIQNLYLIKLYTGPLKETHFMSQLTF